MSINKPYRTIKSPLLILNLVLLLAVAQCVCAQPTGVTVYNLETKQLIIPSVEIIGGGFYALTLFSLGANNFEIIEMSPIEPIETNNQYDPNSRILELPLTQVKNNGEIASSYTVQLELINGQSRVFELLNAQPIDPNTLMLSLVGPALSGAVQGLENVAGAYVLVSSEDTLQTSQLDGGSFRLEGLASGDYVVKVVAEGYQVSISQSVSYTQTGADNNAQLSFEAIELESNPFIFHWQEDQSVSGSEYGSYVNDPVVVSIVGESSPVLDLSAANALRHDYNISLDDVSQRWTQEHAYRFLETLQRIPQELRDYYQAQELPATRWILVNEFLDGDIEVSTDGEITTVSLSTEVFTYASPVVANIDGRTGLFYSKRLFQALLRFVTDNGSNLDAVEKILNERYGVTTLIPDYSELTRLTTAESSSRFQSFNPLELIDIIAAFEEMPEGMHEVTGLVYLVRRLNGTPHPLYPGAPAVAWSSIEQGYIEFMESAFTADLCCQYLQRLIIHEKAHFLWAKLFNQSLKDLWIELGGWFEDAGDPDGWSTTKTTEFVSAYAHRINPNEDMAESIAAYIVNPDILRSRSLPKYEFIRDHIMQGTRYISLIREDLQFEVYDLFPDYVYPGKINSVDIRVDGSSQEDKTITIEIGIHALDLVQEGASWAYLRLFSEIGTFKDVYLYPVDQNGNPSDLGITLRGSFTLDRLVKNGYWITDQIVLRDSAGNQRLEGSNDFGFMMYINNADEDTIPPVYVANSMILSLTEDNESFVPRNVQRLVATWTVQENQQMRSSQACYARLDSNVGQYSYEQYGEFDAGTSQCKVEFVITEYYPTANYSIPYIVMHDEARNSGKVFFTSEDVEPAQSISIVTSNPDISAPVLDLNNIAISAKPSNGETFVTIEYFAMDDKSGLGLVSFNLRDPQGINHFDYHYHQNFYTVFFDGDPTVYKRYEINIVLPAGSAPGTWGLSSLYLRDKANNFVNYDFTEIVRFELLE